MRPSRRDALRGIALAGLLGPRPLPCRGGDAHRSNVLAEFDIRPDSPWLVVPVVVRGRTYPFALDTGARHVLYDFQFKDIVGPPVGAFRSLEPNSISRRDLYDAPEAMLGPLSLRTGEPVECVDLSWTKTAISPRVYGFIGMSFLRRYVFVLDYDARKVRFERGANRDVARASKLAFDRHGGPTIEVRLPGEPPRAMIIDTGHNVAMSLETGLFDAMIRRRSLTVTGRSLSWENSGAKVARRGLLAAATVGGVEIRGVLVDECLSDRMRVGTGLLRRFNATFDFALEEMYLAPAASARAAPHPAAAPSGRGR